VKHGGGPGGTRVTCPRARGAAHAARFQLPAPGPLYSLEAKPPETKYLTSGPFATSWIVIVPG